MTLTTPADLEHLLVTIPLSLIVAWAIYYEYSTYLIRNHLTLTGVLYFLCVHIITGPLPWFNYLVGSALIGLLLFCLSSLCIVVLKADLLGLGTVKFGVMLTAALGPFGGAVSLGIGTFSLLVFGTVHFVATRSHNTLIPTTPFWAFGALSWLTYSAYAEGSELVDYLPAAVF